MGVKLQAASGGSVELVPTNTASSFNVTVPAATTTMVGTDTAQTLTNKTLTTPNIDSAQVATVSGTAPLYMCRAWVNFNGTGTVAIRASGNVSSITDNGVGDYTVNFTTAIVDANYSAQMTAGFGSGSRTALRTTQISDMFAGSVRYNVASSNGVNDDVLYQCVSIFR
jgi:hypothetical protein